MSEYVHADPSIIVLRIFEFFYTDEFRSYIFRFYNTSLTRIYKSSAKSSCVTIFRNEKDLQELNCRFWISKWFCWAVIFRSIAVLGICENDLSPNPINW